MTATQDKSVSLGRFELIEDSSFPGRRFNVYRVSNNFDRDKWQTWGQMVGFVEVFKSGYCGAYSFAASMGRTGFTLPELAASWIAKQYRRLPR